ncbi:hypothetical protein BJ684DRAFT_15162 [Piptocephalis cylindrospora]|uniref:NADH:ubiquinone oxidoreductase 30kDa subunit domain-containing protein n=1 Tax=Piptocephalis cylindrospora TaxID=1907219 RepID=A0A4P9Y945_9FUNG|nr:hypothetical protein BJ684DRAFT_15162 [Piptocephalis cylindrospora]|eukprot:RKP14520.1 hypothetical protein BJ684DRAFT_15162 [Piptocephalis cylindrospora]
MSLLRSALRPSLALSRRWATTSGSTTARLFSTTTRLQAYSFLPEAKDLEEMKAKADPELRSPNAHVHEYGRYLLACLPKFIQSYSVYQDELTIHTAPSGLLPVLRFLRDHTASQYKQDQDVCGADYPHREYRFEVVHHLLSVRHNARIRVKTYTDEVTPVPSAADLFSGANWFEREAWDMYGIYFDGHPDLRRILTDYGFEGFPLRKDFPLTGYTEVRYDEEKKRVVSEPLQLAQAFRDFNYNSAWETVGTGRDESVHPHAVDAAKPDGNVEPKA